MKSGQVSAQTGDPKGALQYYQPEFDRLWKVLSDHDMVITFHLGGRVPRFGEKQYFLPDMPMSKLAMAEPIGIFIFNGIFERFPELRIGSMESGVGWFAWFAEYTDRTWEKQRFWTESVIDKPPSYYMDQQRLGLVHPGPHRHPRSRPAGRQEHHVVLGLSALGNDLPELARGDQARLRGRSRRRYPRHHLQQRQAAAAPRLRRGRTAA